MSYFSHMRPAAHLVLLFAWMSGLLWAETSPNPPALDFGGVAASEIAEVLSADEYVEFVPLDGARPPAVQWDPASGKFLYVPKNAPPFLFLTGTLDPNYEIQWNDQWVPPRRGRFQIRVPLPLEPRPYYLRVYFPGRSFETFRFMPYWIRIPNSIRDRVIQGDLSAQETFGFSPEYRNSACVQLYAAKSAISHLDLDSQKHARLTFRFFPPTVPEQEYDGWRLTLRDERGNVVGEIARLGALPSFIDWREMSTNFHSAGKYSYRVTLYKDDKTYPGPLNEFHAVEGLSLLENHYTPAIVLEPRQELGYYLFKSNTGVTYSFLYIGGELTLAVKNRFLVRGQGQLSLNTPNPENTLTFTRLAAGFRFFSHGASDLLGDPYMARLDVFVGHTGFTTYKRTQHVSRFSHVSLLVEPHLVLWTYHYFVPWIEYGTRTDFTQHRLSGGLSYQFYVRPWSVKLGMGVSYDNLFKFERAPAYEFSVLRAMASFTFYL